MELDILHIRKRYKCKKCKKEIYWARKHYRKEHGHDIPDVFHKKEREEFIEIIK